MPGVGLSGAFLGGVLSRTVLLLSVLESQKRHCRLLWC